MLYTLALMEHLNPAIIDELFTFGQKELLLTFLIDAMYSPTIGFFLDVPITLFSLARQSDSVQMAQNLDSHILTPYLPRISNIISRIFPLIQDPQCLSLALDKYSPPL